MVKDTLTFALDGEITLHDFASGIGNFNLFLDQLSNEVGKNANISWVLEELYTGSAVATFKGVCDDLLVVEKVVNAYEQVGEVLSTGKEIPFSDPIKRYIIALTNIINGNVKSIRFETPSADYVISGSVKSGHIPSIQYSHGTVRGIIETLTRRKKLSFTIWDSLFDRPVHCYFKEGEEENMRSAWGKRAVVAGKIGRQSDTGKPLVIREVKYVRVIEDVEPGSYNRARGLLPWGKGDESPEDMIRMIRDG